MILSVLTGLLFGSDGYYVALAWTSSALMYFTVSMGWPSPLLLWDTCPFLAHSALLSSRYDLCGLQLQVLTAWGAQPLGSISSCT